MDAVTFTKNSIMSLQGPTESVLNNTYVAGFIKIFIILYAVLAAPQLPSWLAKWFHHPVFQVVIFALIAYTATKDIVISLLIALAFFVSFHTYTRHLLSKIVNNTGKLFGTSRKLFGYKEKYEVTSPTEDSSAIQLAKLRQTTPLIPEGSVEGSLSRDLSSMAEDLADAQIPSAYIKQSTELPGYSGKNHSEF